MKLHCGQGHELTDTQKFCGECGSPAIDGGACQCGTTLAKGAKFCSGCGTPVGPLGGGGDLTAALDEVDSYLKARAGIGEADLALPTLDPDDSRESAVEVDRILKAAAVTDKDTGEEVGVDAVPVVSALFKSTDQLTRVTQLHAEHHNDILRAMLDGQTAMMKAVSVIGRTIEKLAATPLQPGRPLGPAGTGLGGDDPAATFEKANAGTGAIGRGPFDDLRGTDLLIKSTTAATRDPSLLSTLEMAAVEHFGNQGATLADIRGVNPELAARVETALRST